MEYLVTGKEMHAYDIYTIEQIGIPSIVLMERAALNVVSYIKKNFSSDSRVLCVCGTGNNGGDGFCVARLLQDKGIKADIVMVGDIEKATMETKTQLSILKAYELTCESQIPDKKYDLVVDAIFGTGLHKEVQGEYRKVIEQINQMHTKIIAVDIPSGIDAETGKVMGVAIKADITITLAFKKRGLYLFPGADYAGEVILADMGITERSLKAQKPGMYTLTDSANHYFPERKKNGNKGTFGKVLLVAGSDNMAGAAILAGRSAYKMGAGMVKLVIPEKIRSIIQEALPDALIQAYESKDKLTETEVKEYKKNMEWADITAIGPGLSICESGNQFISYALATESSKPVLIDADGINLLAKSQKLLKEIEDSTKRKGREIILTPHMGELSRLLGQKIDVTVSDETASTCLAAERTGCIIVGKSARTNVVKQGHSIFLNTAGNDKMATAGSGDVLTGMIAALLAQGVEPLKACVNGVYLHACAGDAAAENAGNAALTASEIMKGLSLL